jgi:hypothetical protein
MVVWIRLKLSITGCDVDYLLTDFEFKSSSELG